MAVHPVRKTPAEIKFRVAPADKAAADQIAASVGMDTNTVMKVMFKRFVSERGFPFDMRAPAKLNGAVGHGNAGETTPFGVSVSRLAQLSGAGFADAARAHEKAGRQQIPSTVVIPRRAARSR